MTAYRFNQHKMTKVIILGEQPESKELKPIEFVQYISCRGVMSTPAVKPQEFDYIELINKRTKIDGLDFMFAYKKGERERGVLYLGNFNDGIV